MTDGTAQTPEQATQTGPYRVLARKYRPGTFAELIGQAPMVRTLKNAIDSGRLAHAFVLTGVRGVGKTTTARLIARALNCVGADGNGPPTTEPCGVCRHCTAIAESRHVDVIEMDAASRTGVDDVREIIDGVRYAPGDARFKIYIIDEVHMLSRNAFNALLKTLEEPPPHVKFIFATTEIRKVPITVLSRCQRFDLRRVETASLKQHFANLATKESVAIDDDALAMIARAADGSVRDGLSLLDQAIAHGGGAVDAAQVRDMLGLADRARVLDLFEAVMAGDIKTALANVRDQYNSGADPAAIIEDLLGVTHWLTQLKAAPDVESGDALPEAERRFGERIVGRLAMPALTRAWQMLLKGLEETRSAPTPIGAAEMTLIRLAYAADLPSPADLVKRLQNAAPGGAASPAPAPPSGGNGGASMARGNGGGGRAEPAPMAQPEIQASGLPQPRSFQDVVALAIEHREGMLEAHLTDNVHLVRFQPGRIELRPGPRAPADLIGKLSQRLSEWTGTRWIVTVSREQGEATLTEQKQASDARIHNEVIEHPLVRAALRAFPGAQVTSIIESTVAEAPALDEDAIIDPDMDDTGELDL
ncbi:DNA polymerase III subunit gamma/tau [Iodidimonas sp. SYSU 1G8]|uniref:DNA polymerase III subunit gamma/tau n=1 Tax=Iodidimonas sp. SYSU 1G8 TaxID=3133967 RepID=UPI0031FEA4E0